jgi:hypothetical protein
VKFQRAPFDHPELIVPVDGTAPDNTRGRSALLADTRFRRIPPVGAAGSATPLPNFLGLSSREGDPGPDHFDSVTSTAPPPPPTLVLTPPVPGTAGVANTWVVTGATPGAVVGVYASLGTGSTVLNLGNCGGLRVDLATPLTLFGRTNADASGRATIVMTPALSTAGRTYFFQAVEPSTCRTSNLTNDTL